MGGSREACPKGKKIQTIDSIHFMDKDTLYQKGLKQTQSKGYTGEFVLHFAEEFVQGTYSSNE